MSDRDDAALVWRHLRAAGEGGATVVEMAEALWPVAVDVPEGAGRVALRRRAVARVLGAVVWMRAAGVGVFAASWVGDATRFHLVD